jgi:hypothetical protein
MKDDVKFHQYKCTKTIKDQAVDWSIIKKIEQPLSYVE